jgi:chromosome segregation ATPase
MKNEIERRSANIQMDEFLLKTIVELKVTLSKIESDSDQKTDILHDATDSLTAIAYTMKEFKDKADSLDDAHKEISKQLDIVINMLSVSEIKFESENKKVEEHIKEIKYAIQKINGSSSGDSKKKDFSSYFTSIVDGIKNVRFIFIIVLIITIIVGTLINGGSKNIIDILKAVTGVTQ